ncbi:MAG: excinuclease ABC subunit UvrC [Eubacteriales bacterium]|nr:excinuclease ABC subunit UvrC [Eubacteriales bacterium]
MFDIQENLKKLPASPGVYMHKDKLGHVIYVGKAISLRNRVRQYFQSSKTMDAKVRAMVGHIAEFEYITCGSEMEAFILECNLIKKYKPKYNVLLRDDKTYPYIKVTTASEAYPRVVKTRRLQRNGDKYFGPYSDVGAVNQMVDLLNGVYRLKRCSAQSFRKGFRPCLNYHIGQCDGICTGHVSREAYLQRVESALAFLKGHDRKLTEHLKKEMEKASEALNYEKAALYRDYLRAAEALSEKQRVVMRHAQDIDVVLSAGEGAIVVFFVRDGKLVGRESYDIQTGASESPQERVGEFIRLHYGGQSDGPSEFLVSRMPEEADMIAQYLSRLWGRKTEIAVPKRGEKKALLDLAMRDVTTMVDTLEERKKNRREREEKLGRQIHDILSLAGLTAPYQGERYRMEAYDISNTNGVDTVGGMVVFVGSRPERKSYRRFKIRTVDGPDDYASMQEMIYRRFRRAQKGDPAFRQKPDALLIDGGKGHVAAVHQVMEALKIDVPVLGMAKDDSHRTRALVWREGGEYHEEPLAAHPLLFTYLGNVQEEVHRFAIAYHRSLRSKRTLHSVLDEIQGIGPKKRNQLLEAFGSVEEIKKADKQTLMKVDGITESNAEAIQSFFHASSEPGRH